MEDNIFKEFGIWTEKWRPSTLDQLVITPANLAFINEIKRRQEIPNLMMMGAPGIGKSTLSKILVNDILSCQYLYINASEENGINDIRSKVMVFAQTRSIDGKIKVVILDEADFLSSASQAALRNIMEEYAGTTRFILTCNYPFKIIPALHSRCQELDVTPPFEGVLTRCVQILKAENIQVPAEAKPQLLELIKSTYPDVRKCINRLQKSSIDGKFVMAEFNNTQEITEDIMEMLLKNTNLTSIREFIISKEIDFSNDYHMLLKSLFDKVYDSDIPNDKKRNAMLIISEGMYRHNQVMDTEINAFSCIVSLSKCLN